MASERLTDGQERALRLLLGGPLEDFDICRRAGVKPRTLDGITMRGLARRDGGTLTISASGREHVRRRDDLLVACEKTP